MQLSSIIYDRNILPQLENYRISEIVNYFYNILSTHAIDSNKIIGARNTFNVYVSALSSYLDLLSGYNSSIQTAPSSNHTHETTDLFDDNNKLTQVLLFAADVRSEYYKLKNRLNALAAAVDNLYGPCLYSYDAGRQMLRDYGFLDNTRLSVNTLTLFNNFDKNHKIDFLSTDTLSGHTLESEGVIAEAIDTDILLVATVSALSTSTTQTYIGQLTLPNLGAEKVYVLGSSSFVNLTVTYMTTNQFYNPLITSQNILYYSPIYVQ